jgi:hypothetical protein
MRTALSMPESVPSEPLGHVAIGSMDGHINGNEASIGAHEISLVGVKRKQVIAGAIPSVPRGRNRDKAAIRKVAGDFLQTRCGTLVGSDNAFARAITNTQPVKFGGSGATTALDRPKCLGESLIDRSACLELTLGRIPLKCGSRDLRSQCRLSLDSENRLGSAP